MNNRNSVAIGKKLEIPIDVNEYVNKLTDLNCLKFVVVGKVLETGKHYVGDCNFQLYNKDCIGIKVSKMRGI